MAIDVWVGGCVLSRSVTSNSLQPLLNCNPSGSSVHGILKVRILDWFPFSSAEDLPNPGMEFVAPAPSPGLQEDFTLIKK